MTEIDRILDPFLELETNEHHAALVRQVVAVAVIIVAMLILVALRH